MPTREEIARIASGDHSVMDSETTRLPTLDEMPPRPVAKGKWTRALPTTPRHFPEWALDAAAGVGMEKDFADGMTLLWVEGDARLVSLDAHAAILDQHEAELVREHEYPEDETREVRLTLERGLPPTPTGFIGWEAGQLWLAGWDGDGKPLGSEARVFGWDFRPQLDARTNEPVPGGDVVSIYTFVANPDLTTVWRHAIPVQLGVPVLTSLGGSSVWVDPDGWATRVLRPNDDDPYRNGRIVALNMSSTLAAAAVIWTLLNQGGLIETVTRTRRNRSARRRAARRSLPDVELVRVRRRHTELVNALEAPDATAEERTRERDFRWVVSGHWRMQPHGPERSLRKPVFIEPHVKGPEGAPIRRSRRVLIL